ncbi:MAG: MFS transporter [Bacteroides sp.]|nr:MFS transporter [Eubacterium sp.]MCM1417672.1 MFS transporter [Roseburia sp.]MCM1461862.1 MFS transporter [Bacteroides sp.]
MKKFILIWIGELISSIGSGMTAFALSVYIFAETGSVTYVSLVTLFSYLPTILLSPLGGALADRYDRRILMVIGDLFSGLGLVFVLWEIDRGDGSVLPILLGVGFSAVFVALLEPSFKATITDLLTEEEYARASGMVQMAGNARYLISPALAGILLAVSDIRLILLLDIATFFVTVTTVLIVRRSIQKPIKREREKLGHALAEAFSAMKNTRGVLSLVLLMAGVCFFVGFLQTLTEPMILSVSDAKTAGLMESFCAVGMLAGSVVIGVVGIKRDYTRVLGLAGVLGGLFMALAGVNKSLIITGAGIFLFFLFLPFINTCADVLIRLSIPNELQGRVWGLISLLSQLGTVIAYAFGGVAADHLFEPLFREEGALADSLGRLIGTGAGRGIGFMLILSGLGMAVSAALIGRDRNIRSIEEKEIRE